MSVLDRLRTLIAGNGHAKAFTSIQPEPGRVLLPATRINYAREIGDGLGSSVLIPPLTWIMRNFPQAPAVVERLRKEEWAPIREHPLTELLREPNPFYGGRELWMATVLDFTLGGNAYWLKIRNVAGDVVQLWWAPSLTMTPRWPTDGSVFISHYDYDPGGGLLALDDVQTVRFTRISGGRKIQVKVEDVVHLRNGLDPRNVRLGLGPLGALAREVFTDDQAANFASVILRNLGIIGVVISPKERGAATKEDVEATKQYLLEHFTGDKRGQPLALGQPTEVNLLQYNVQGFDVSPLRDVSEERVCAALGIPAAVVGFGTGLQTTKVGVTMREMRRMAWTDCVIPMQGAIAEQVARQLLGGFESRPERARVRFDLAPVPALWEDENEKHGRVRADYLAGLITRAHAKRELGVPVGDGDEIYAQPMNVLLLKPGELPDERRPPSGGRSDAAPDA